MKIEEAFEHVPFLRAVPLDARQHLYPYAELRVLKRAESLWGDGQATGEFTFLIRGRVKLVKSSAGGRQTIVDLSFPGRLLCANAPCAFVAYCCSAVAIEDQTEILSLPRRDLLDLIERDPALTRAFLREVTERGISTCQRVDALGSGHVKRRLAIVLFRLADQIGQDRGEEGIWIPVALSRQDLADLCGTTVETAIRVMSKLARDGIVQTVARGFMLLDRPALQRLASDSDEASRR